MTIEQFREHIRALIQEAANNPDLQQRGIPSMLERLVNVTQELKP